MRIDLRAGLAGLALAVTLGLTLVASAGAASFDLNALTTVLAQRKSAEAKFTEERFVTGLDLPLRASGTLSFTAPDRFVRTVIEPRAESMSVEGNTVTLKRGGRSRSMAVDAIPELTALIEAVRGTLTGDAATLTRHFNTKVEGGPALWTLTLVPRDSRLAAQVRELKIAGQADMLRSVELFLSGGDRSLMLIDPPK